MDFTMSVIDSSRGIPSTQPTHPISVVTPLVATTDQPLLPQPQPVQPPSPSQPEQEQQEDENEKEEEQQQQPQQPQPQQQQQPHELEQQDQLQPQPRNSALHESSAETEMEVEEEEEEEELHDLTKDDPEEALTPPPRVSSVTLHHGNRVEKSTDTDDFEPLIKVEIRDIDDFEPVIKVEIQGELLGLNTGDKEKDQIVQLHFNNVSEVLHYFSQWSVPQHIDAFNFLTSPDLVRSINPDLMRNHFLYVLNPQEGVRLASNGCSSLGPTTTPTPPSQVREPTPPLTEKQDSGSSSSYSSKQEDPQHQSGLASTLLLQTPDQNGRLVTLSPGTGTTSSSSAVTTSPTSHHGGQSSSSSSSSHLGSSGTSGVIHHQRGYNQKGEPVPRPYQCGVCGRAFIRNEHLRRHLLIHSGEKPHACGTCSKAFSRREHLTKHMRSHIKVTIPGSVPPTSQSGPVQVSGVSVSLPSPQPSLTLPQSVATSLPTSSVVVTPASAAHQQSPHSVSHTVAAAAAASHGTPVAHAAHLPPGTHYLPMFGLLAEVV